MNPYASDLHEPLESNEQLPAGLSFASLLAGLIMLLFGLVCLSSLGGALMNVAQIKALSSTTGDQSPAGTTTAVAIEPSSYQIAILIGSGVLDFLLGIPMIVWSIGVLRRKRSAALKLSGLALFMALLEIPRGIVGFYVLTPILESTKLVVSDLLEKNAEGKEKLSPANLEMIFQTVTYTAIGCFGISLVFAFLIYLFCFFQLRKPSTLARLSA